MTKSLGRFMPFYAFKSKTKKESKGKYFPFYEENINSKNKYNKTFN